MKVNDEVLLNCLQITMMIMSQELAVVAALVRVL